MHDVFYIEDMEQARTLLKPARLEILKQLDEPRTCPDLAQFFGESAQKIYYHIKELEKAGLVAKVEEKRVRGAVEGHYQAVARSYWLAPRLVGKIGDPNLARDQMSLRVLLDLAEDVQEDIGHLGMQSTAGEPVPSMSMSGQVHLPDGARRSVFLAEVQTVFQDLLTKYGQVEVDEVTESAEFRLVLMCYPQLAKDE